MVEALPVLGEQTPKDRPKGLPHQYTDRIIGILMGDYGHFP